MTQQQIRNMIIDLHTTKGISYKFIANEIGISASHFSKFIKGTRSLGEAKYNKALEYLQEVK